MGWCHCQNSDGNCDHSNDKSKKGCPPIDSRWQVNKEIESWARSEVHHLFVLANEEVTLESLMNREKILDDLGIRHSGTADDVKLRNKLLQFHEVIEKININKGKKRLKAEIVDTLVKRFSHEIRFCRCHMLPTDIIPGQRNGSCTYTNIVTLRLYTKSYLRNLMPAERTLPKNQRETLTPLATHYLKEADEMLGVIKKLKEELAEVKHQLAACIAEKNTYMELANARSQSIKEIETLKATHEEEKTTFQKRLANSEETKVKFIKEALFWKEIAQKYQESESKVSEGYHEIRLALGTLEGKAKKDGSAITYEAKLIEYLCEASGFCYLCILSIYV